MTIASIFPPCADLPNGYTVTASEWNGQFDSIFNYLNSTVKPAIDALQSAPAPIVGAQSFFNARLTLETGVPISSADQSGKTTIYLTPFGGNLIGLYDSVTGWANYALSGDVSLAVPSVKRQLVDIFAAQSSGTVILEAGLYKNITATNNPSASDPMAASPGVVITCADTSPFTVGDVVSVSDGSNAEECVITAISAGVSITVDWLKNSYTTPNLASQTPVTALALQDGVLVKSSDHSRRYVGTISTDATGQTHDKLSARLVGNFYHRTLRPMRAASAAASYTYPFPVPTGYRPHAASKVLGEERLLFVAAQHCTWQAAYQRSAAGVAFGVGFDQSFGITGYPVFQPYAASSSPNNVFGGQAHGHTVTRGRHFLQSVFQHVDAGTITTQSIFSGIQVGWLQAMVLN